MYFPVPVLLDTGHTMNSWLWVVHSRDNVTGEPRDDCCMTTFLASQQYAVGTANHLKVILFCERDNLANLIKEIT